MPLKKVFILYLRRTRRKFNVYICERIDNFRIGWYTIGESCDKYDASVR